MFESSLNWFFYAKVWAHFPISQEESKLSLFLFLLDWHFFLFEYKESPLELAKMLIRGYYSGISFVSFFSVQEKEQ